jgi:hypothetical protein
MPFTRSSRLVALVFVFGCTKTQPTPQVIPLSGQQSSSTVLGPPKEITDLPLTMTIKQRSTSQVPGADGVLSITIDDITRGQAMITILGRDRDAIAGPLTMKVGDALPLDFGGEKYTVRVNALNNSLVAEDFAEIILDRPTRSKLTEAEKIEKLISAIEGLEGATFVRNGQAHSTDESVSHLRRKLESAGQRIKTAKDFIEQIASKSSLTGDEYMIRMPNGQEAKASDFLIQELGKLKESP